jgi:uncharacterized protein DUF4261
MENGIVICVPGTWESRTEFVEAVVTSTGGDFVFAGGVLFHAKANDHVNLEFCGPDDRMLKAFELGGQGKLTNSILDEVAKHKSCLYLHFPCHLVSQKPRLLKFSEVVSRCGGIAVKLETSGIAHQWQRWSELLRSTNPFDTYCACVVLVGDERFYYSCGMHNFRLPDAQISNSLNAEEAADLLNRFNYWQIIEGPNLKSGNKINLTADADFRLKLLNDVRHLEADLFHNSNGLWELQRG